MPDNGASVKHHYSLEVARDEEIAIIDGWRQANGLNWAIIKWALEEMKTEQMNLSEVRSLNHTNSVLLLWGSDQHLDAFIRLDKVYTFDG